MGSRHTHFDGRTATFEYREESSSDLQVISEVWDDDVYRVAQMVDLQFDTILDIGANIGAFTVLAHKIWPDAHILAVEPENENYSLLQQNVRSNTLGVRCMQYAVTSHDHGVSLNPYYGNTQIAAPGDLGDTYGLEPNPWRDTAWMVALDSGAGTLQQHVPSKTLDQTLDDLTFGELGLLKMDIEGAELEVFQTFQHWNRIQYITMECHVLDSVPPDYYTEILSQTHDMLFVSTADIFAVRRT